MIGLHRKKNWRRRKRRRKRAAKASVVMFHEISNFVSPQALGARAAPVGASLPPELAVSERAVAALRSYLIANGLSEYRVFYCENHGLYDVEECLGALGETCAWEALPATVAGGEPLEALTHDDKAARIWNVGCLRLSVHEVVLARWYWIDADSHGIRVLWLCAAPSAAHFHRLTQAVQQHRRANAESVW